MDSQDLSHELVSTPGKVTVTNMRSNLVQHVCDTGLIVVCRGRGKTVFRFFCPACNQMRQSRTLGETQSRLAIERHMQRHTAAELRAWQISQWLCDEPEKDWVPF